MRKSLIIGLALGLLTACAHDPEPLGGAPGIQVLNLTELPLPAGANGDGSESVYRLAALDKINVDVFGVDALAREIQVDGNGDILYPLIGQVHVGGRTPNDVATEIAGRLRGRYVRDPHVTVNLKEVTSHTVAVGGQVNQAGLYPVSGPMTLMRAVDAAGGTNEFAKLEDVVVFRKVGDAQYAGLYNLAAIRRGAYADPRIYAGDIVEVGDAPNRRLFSKLLTASGLLVSPLIALINQI